MLSRSFFFRVDNHTFVFRGIAISLIVSRWRLYPAFWSSVMSCFIVFIFSFTTSVISSFFESSASFFVSNFIVDLDSGRRLFVFRKRMDSIRFLSSTVFDIFCSGIIS